MEEGRVRGGGGDGGLRRRRGGVARMEQKRQGVYIVDEARGGSAWLGQS